MKNLIIPITSFAMVASSIAAGPAQVTANLNFRTGPDSSASVLATIPDGSDVNLLECNDSGAWCAVEYGGETGFVSGKYLVEVEGEDASRWPRAFGLEGESYVVLYEPQFSNWEDFRTLEALVAAEFRESEDATPIFGVIGLKGETARDSDSGSVVISDMQVTQMDFAALDRNQLAKLSVGVGELLPTGAVDISEERIVAGLASYQQVTDVEGLKAEAPQIFVSEHAGRLLQTDGEAVFAPVQGAPGVEFVINTNWDLFRVGDALWLRDGGSWVTSTALDGDWSETLELPVELSALPDDGNWDDARAALEPVAYDQGAPDVFYTDMQAELVLFNGAPEFEDVPGGDLEWAKNTESDVFRHKPSGTFYFLISGRWFSAPSLDGPWTFATPELPQDFLNIPDDVPYYTVRASVPGTSEANEARLRAAIPELASVTLSEVPRPDVVYVGDPEFQSIEGTSLSYATNTQSQIIQVGAVYFLVVDGIWFTSDSANGPWEPATQVPDEIYEIPPSSAVHNVTYVRVYESDDDDDEAIYGFTAGYLFGFLAWGVFVHGTGWYYPPYWYYWGPGHHYHRYPVYYPRPLSYGGGSYYNPARGSYGRYGYAYGPYRGVEARTAWNPRTGTYARGAKVYGPGGTRGFVHASNPRTGTKLVARGGESIYGKWGSASVRRGSEYLNVKAGERDGGGKGVKWDSSRGNGFGVSDRRGNTYAGRNGNVYRKSGDSWEKWDPGSGWEGVAPPKRDELKRDPARRDQVGQTARDRAQARQDAGGGQRQLPQAARDRAQNRDGAGTRVPDRVGRDADVRARANQRSNQARSVPQQRAKPQVQRPKPQAQPRAKPQVQRPKPQTQRPKPQVQKPQRQVQRTPTRSHPQQVRRPSGGGGNFKGRRR